MRIEYTLHYKKYSNIDGYVLKDMTFDTKEELKKYIKEELKKEDVIISIYKKEITRLNLEEM